jgi:hypothetical protein
MEDRRRQTPPPPKNKIKSLRRQDPKDRRKKKISLERINPRLPLPSQLDADLDALVDVLGAALVVDAELQDVAVFDLVGAAVRCVVVIGMSWETNAR